jgi:hypothetical protein
MAIADRRKNVSSRPVTDPLAIAVMSKSPRSGA